MSFPRYPAYKDSGVEWLGEVPAHWESWKLSHAFESIGSGTTPPSTEAHWYEGGTIPWVTTGELRENVITETSKRVTEAALEKFTALRVHPAGSLVIAMYGATIGRLGVLGVAAATNQACCVIANPQALTVPFTYFWLQGFKQVIIDLFSSGGGQPNISQDVVSSLRIPAPSLSEQALITDFLDRETAKIDALVAEQEQLIALLKGKRQAVISHAVTKGLDPSVPMKDSGIEWLGEVPAHWSVKALKCVATVQTGVAKGKDNTGKKTVVVPYLRVANVQDGYLALDDMAEIEIPSSDLPRYLLRSGDVLMNEGGDFDKLGRGHVWRAEIEPCIHQNHVFAVRPHSVAPEWLNTVTSSSYAQFYFMSRSKQSTNLASISSTSIMELPVVLPPPAEQQHLLAFLERSTAQLKSLIEEAVLSIELLRERRSALISAAVTGQIDVRAWAEREAA